MIRAIHEIHRENRRLGKPSFSIEFFPPKTEEGELSLFRRTIPELLSRQFDYCSVTYGAGGSTRDKTISIVERIQREYGLTAMMHLTCVNATREELLRVVQDARARGIRNLLALRGDPPDGAAEWTPTTGGFRYSAELVAFLRHQGGFSIGTAGFPEGHIAQKAGKLVDWGYLRDKIQAGADFVVTQLFFDNADYFAFRDHLTARLGVTVPLIPGVLPVLTRSQTRRFVALCGARLPAPFLERLDAFGDDDDAVTRFGIDYATQQCMELLREGAPGIHFYTLNKARSTAEIAQRLGIPPASDVPPSPGA